MVSRLVCTLAALLCGVLPARADEDACARAIAVVERTVPVLPHALGAIATVESGRSVGSRIVPWPWSINAEGVGHWYGSKQEAIEAVRTMQAAGLRSIDVGCMQINLLAHPRAFASLEDAFDPLANAHYAARFLRTLYDQTGRWSAALSFYHSHTPRFALEYARRLVAVWPGAAERTLTGDPPPAVRSTATHSSHPRASLIQVVSPRGPGWPGFERLVSKPYPAARLSSRTMDWRLEHRRDG